MGDKAKELLNRVHSAIVDLITKKLEAGTINEDRAKEIAREVLKRLPEHITYEELIRVIPKLDDDYKELAEVVVPIMVEYEQKIRVIINQKISALMQQQKYDEALELAKKAIEFEKGLT
jgi:hypothetical protein